jgi:hypothetical protein
MTPNIVKDAFGVRFYLKKTATREIFELSFVILNTDCNYTEKIKSFKKGEYPDICKEDI